MEIRDDFKVDFDGWKKEAKLLCRKAIVFIFVFCFFIPFGVYYLLEQFHVVAPSLNVLHFPLASFFLLFFSMFSAFYMMFYFKRIDFEEPKNIINIIRDILYTSRNFMEYTKLHIAFFYIMAGLTIFSFFMGAIGTMPYPPKNYPQILASSLSGVYISFYFLLSATQRYIFGVVYIGYGMVNKEGANILTINAYNKYPELMKYVIEKSLIFQNVYIFGWVFMIMSGNDILRYIISSVLILWSIYQTAIYYLISRDLYGGKKQTQKVTEHIEDIGGAPSPL